MGREDRPPDAEYYSSGRTNLLSQGDIFAAVPRVFAQLAEEVITDLDGSRRFLSGPLETGYAMLVTPSCSMGGDNPSGSYEHPVRTLVPLVSIADLSPRLTQEQLGAARRHDGLINYMYLPPIGPDEMPASLALLYMPFTLDHDLLMSLGRRITQLALVGAQQLHRKLAWYATGLQVDRTWFRPALD